MPAFFDQATMPRRTYGGRAAGGPTMMDHAMNMLGSQGMNAAALGNQYAPMHQSPLAMAPTTAGGYLGQMANQNPGGRFFGGALPAYGTSSGGNVRPMWMGPPQDPTGGVTPGMQRNWGMKNGYYTNSTGTMSPLSGVQNGSTGFSPHDIALMQLGGGPNHVAAAPMARDQRYWSMGLNTPEFRQAGVQANAMAKGQARKDSLRMQRGQLSMPEQMAFGIPGYANQQLQNQNSMGWMGLQGQMFQQKQMADQQQGHFTRMAQLAQAIPQMGLPLGQQQQMMQHIFGQLGLPGGPAGGQPAGMPQQRANYYLTPQQQGQIRGMKTAKEKEDFLNAQGIMDPITRQHLLGVGQQPRPGLASQFGDSIASGLLNAPHYLNPWNWGSNGPAAFSSSGEQGYIQKWLNPYEVTGLSPQAKRALKGGKK